jgi:hypothetical protein
MVPDAVDLSTAPVPESSQLRPWKLKPRWTSLLCAFPQQSKECVYINFMSGDEQDRVPEAYHERWDRIVAFKISGDWCASDRVWST